jgi:UDP-N-acetylmuramate dehydrogenase
MPVAPMSLQLCEQVSLKAFNSFGIEVRARLLVQAHNDQQVREALALGVQRQLPVLVIGGGSNLLLTRDVEALVLHMASRGLRILADDGARVLVEAEAGEPWHPFVQWTLQQGLGGLENLSLIPGTVGAAPMQNIGAYGVELKDHFAGLTALDRRSGELCDFSQEDCAFAYRDSLFKHEAGRWLILRVRFALNRVAAVRLDYGPLRQRLSEQGIEQPTPLQVSQAICAIRREKLPDPAELGNAGSFFKNPLVPAELAERLRCEYPDLVAYPQADGRVKLAAGWLIERAGWKGFRQGEVGVHRLQALVLVNYGNASGQQVLDLARQIQADVARRFAVELEMEPNLY